MRVGWALPLGLACACSPAQPPLAYGEAPRVSIRMVDGLSAVDLPGAIPMWSATDEPVAGRVSLLVGALPGEPVTGSRTLPVIAGLYGLRPVARVTPGFVPPGHPLRGDFAEWVDAEPQALSKAADEAAADALAGGAALLVTEAPDLAAALEAEAALDAALTERGLSRRTLRVVLGVPTGSPAAPGGLSGTLALRLLGAEGEPLDAPFACAIDLLPTLLAAVGAVPPSDAQGRDLRAEPRRPEEACVQHGADGSLGASSPLGHLSVPAGVALEGPLPGVAQVWGADGAQLPAGGGATGAALWAALVQHEQRARAQTAGGRVGEERLRGVLRANGYW